jgi:hypothetical protein
MTTASKGTTEKVPAKRKDLMPGRSRALTDGPRHSYSNGLVDLQACAGNQAVNRLLALGDVQAKLRVGQPGDPLEREADRVADEILRTADDEPEVHLSGESKRVAPQPAVQPISQLTQRKKEEEEEEDEEGDLSLKAKGLPRQRRVADEIEKRIGRVRGGGQPLSESVRSFFEPRLGYDLSRVRVHTGSDAAGAAQKLGAHAFTYRNDIFLGAGRYRPETSAGRHLLSHELTHVVQQRSAPARVNGMLIQCQAAAGSEAAPADTKTVSAPGVMDLKGMARFEPPPRVSEWLSSREDERARLDVCYGKIARGAIEVRKGRGGFEIASQAIPMSHPLFAGIGESAPGLQPSLIVSTKGDRITGYVGLAAGRKAPSPGDLAARLKRAPALMGLAGIDLDKLPKITNTLEGGNLSLGLKDVPITLGRAFTGTISIAANDEKITTFTGRANVKVKGLSGASLDLTRSETGVLAGQVAVDLALPKSFTGSVVVVWDGQDISGTGKVGYTGEKFSGEVALNVMEREKARQLEVTRKAPPEAEAAPASEKGARKAKRADYVVFGEGDLTFAFTDWLSGTAHVIVDSKGCVTVIGKITPQKEIELFPQKDYNKKLFKVEARAAYGVPVVGNIFIFANIGMDAFANIGPAKFYNIVIEGTYSTDPKVSKDFSVRGSLNVSAGAGLRLRGEAGAGLEILAHDIKAGAGVNALAAIRGYAEATPIIGYRERAKEGEDKKGEFFIRGELEIAAQPFLGLGGDLFVEIDAPFWSPVPDKKWTWPLFNKEYPIGGTFGIGAAVDYVFGSDQLPAVEFKPVEFSADKFFTDLYSDKAKPKSGKEKDRKAGWKEKNAKGTLPPKKAKKGHAKIGKAPELPPAKATVKPGGPRRPKRPVDPNARTAEGKTVKDLQDEALRKGKKPETKEPTKGVGKKEPAAAEPAKKAHDEQLRKGLAALDAVTRRYAETGASKEELVAGVKSVRRKFKVFKSITVVEGKETWDYEYVADPGRRTGPKKSKKVAKEPKPLAKDDQIEVRSARRWLLADVSSVVPDSHVEYVGAGGRGRLSFAGYGKSWRRYVPERGYKTGAAWIAIKDLSRWTSFNDARQSLNYRHHSGFKNAANSEWHHIHEQNAGGEHSVRNLGAISTTNHQDLTKWYGQLQPGTGAQSMRDWLKGRDPEEHFKWGLKAITLHRLRRVARDLGRGPFYEIV